MSSLVPRGLIRRGSALASESGGGVAIYVSLALMALIGCIGIGFDTGRAYIVKSRLSTALDAAALVGGQDFFETTRDADIEKFLAANFPEHQLSAKLGAVTITPGAMGERITVESTATVPTTFMRIFGVDQVTVRSASTVNRAIRQMELALVMDNTGSMWTGSCPGGCNMAAMKSAAEDLVKLVYGPAEEHDNLLVSLVPYTATVNVGPDNFHWLDPSDRYFDVPDPYSPSSWKGCVEARPQPYDQTDDPPSVHPFKSFYYPNAIDNLWYRESHGTYHLSEAVEARNEGRGPNLGCGPAILPLTRPKSTVINAIRNMAAWHRGGTTSNLGLVWGWRTLSPRWRGLWSGVAADRPLDYADRIGEKVIVLLTDGDNQVYDWPREWYFDGNTLKNRTPGAGPDGSDYTAYGRLNQFGYGSIAAAKVELDNRMSAMCAAIKATGIKMFTITFGASPNAATKTMFEQCATEPTWYYHAPDGDTLKSAFREIGRQLSNLRLSL